MNFNRCTQKWMSVILGAACLIGFPGCKPAGPTDAVKELGGAFSKTAADISDEARKNKELAELAMAAARSNDLQTVGFSLQSLRSSKSLTLDQRLAVQDAMVGFQGSLAERADRGDPAAKAALDSLRGGHVIPR